MKQLKTNETYTLLVYLSADCPSKIIDIKEEEKQQPGFARKKTFVRGHCASSFSSRCVVLKLKKAKRKKKILALLYKPLLFLNIHKFVFTTGSFVLLCSLLTFR